MFIEKLHQRGPTMPQSQKQVAAYFCSHLERASYQTIAQIAAATGVSETTVVRLAYTMDYSSFSEMQRDIRKELLTGQAWNEDCPQKDQDPYGYLLQHELSSLQETMRLLDRDNMDKAVDMLCQADRVYLLGRRSSAAACAWFIPNASMIRDNVSSIQELNDLIDVTKNSVALVVAYHPYAKDTMVMVHHLKSIGCKVISLTDSFLSPLAELSDTVLVTGSAKSEQSFCNAITGPVAVMNVLLIGMARKLPEAKQRMRRSRVIREQFNVVPETEEH